MAHVDITGTQHYTQGIGQPKAAVQPQPPVELATDPLTGGTTSISNPNGAATPNLSQMIPGAYFGFKDGVDNTAAFAALSNYLLTTSRTQRAGVMLPQGTLYADSILLPAWQSAGNQRGSFVIEGSGMYGTTIVPNATSGNPVFASFAAGAQTGVSLRNLGFQGSINLTSAVNLDQIGFALYGDASPGGAFDGGVWNSLFENVRVELFDAEQILIKGGNNDANKPQQFQQWINILCNKFAGSTRSLMRGLGQIGQMDFRTIALSNNGSASSSLAPGLFMGSDPRTAVAVSSVSTVNGLFTMVNNSLMLNGEKVCLVGSARPTGLTGANTIYYLTNLVQISNTQSTFGLASTAANAIARTPIIPSTAGTPASFFVLSAGLTPTSVNTSTGEFTVPLPHLMATGDEVRVYGANLPTGTALATNYFIIKTGWTTFKLATSLANANARTSIAISSTGTAGDFGFAPTFNTGIQSTYATTFGNLTTQGNEWGACFDAVAGVQVDAYIERGLKGIVARNSSLMTIDRANMQLIQDGGAGPLIETQGSGTNVYVDCQIRTTSGFEKIINATGGGTVQFGSRIVDNGNQYTTGSGITAPWGGQTRQSGVSVDTLNIENSTSILLSPSATSVNYIKSKLMDGEEVTMRVWTGAPSYAVFGSGGNIDLGGDTTMQLPSGATVKFKIHDLGTSWTLVSVHLPWHTASWTLSGTQAANSSVSTTVTCPGAVVGDPAPAASVNAALTAGLILTAEVTAADTVTVKITNPTTGALALPTNPTVKVRQVR